MHILEFTTVLYFSNDYGLPMMRLDWNLSARPVVYIPIKCKISKCYH